MFVSFASALLGNISNVSHRVVGKAVGVFFFVADRARFLRGYAQAG